MQRFDVYAYGVIAASTLHLLSQPFPPSEGYAEIERTYPMTGGEALNSSIVLSRLGLRVLLDGNWIGDTAEGRWLLETIQGYKIDARRLRARKGYSGVREVVFSDVRSRTIFGTYVDLLSGRRKWNIPRKADLAKAKIVCVDPPFRDESLLVGRYATELGIPFVTIDCPYSHELAIGAEAVIVSREFRRQEYPQSYLAELFSEYQQRVGGLVVFTAGSEDILYGRKGEPVRRFQPCRVKTKDSTGAGDSFRAGIIHGTMNKWSDGASVRYAAALAAMVCTSVPGVLDSPTHDAVMQFLHRVDVPLEPIATGQMAH